MFYSTLLFVSFLSVASAGLRGDAVKAPPPTAAPTTLAQGVCSQSGAAGRSCSSDISCFADRSNYLFSGPTVENPFYSLSVNNCISKGPNTTISFISISNCGSACRKTSTVLQGTPVYSFNFLPGSTCTDLCIYVHDGQYKLSKPNTVTFAPAETGCISNDNQRCNLCDMKINVCRGTDSPSAEPTTAPTFNPSAAPSAEPTYTPTEEPTFAPTASPTAEPTFTPTASPTTEPTFTPTASPTAEPTFTPTASPTEEPTFAPTASPTAEPTFTPTASPTAEPTFTPTASPTAEPTFTPTAEPTFEPTASPTAEPTFAPTASPTVEPTATPSAQPTEKPSAQPTVTPSAQPTVKPSAQPTVTPSAEPTVKPSFKPTFAPTFDPSVQPTFSPTVALSSCNPTCQTGFCCCNYQGVSSCVSQTAYGAGLDCPTVCNNNACSAYGYANGNYRTCGCMKACSGADCSNLGSGGRVACGGTANCCCGKATGTGSTLLAACTNCLELGWLSAANCAEIVSVGV